MPDLYTRHMENNNLGTDQVRWDLSIFYSGIDDPQIDKDLAALVAREKKFYEDHKGKLTETLGSGDHGSFGNKHARGKNLRLSIRLNKAWT